jgi:hypothetical protein
MLIFGIKVKPIDEEIPSYWIEHDIFHYKTLNGFDMYNINQFGTFKLDVDFNEPLMYYNQMIEMMEGVEKECPIGKYFSVSGVGEGMVFKTSFIKINKNGNKITINGSIISDELEKELISKEIPEGVTYFNL